MEQTDVVCEKSGGHMDDHLLCKVKAINVCWIQLVKFSHPPFPSLWRFLLMCGSWPLVTSDWCVGSSEDLGSGMLPFCLPVHPLFLRNWGNFKDFSSYRHIFQHTTMNETMKRDK